ncbi:hypothetical protein [Bradyrhizobium sp. SRL28]|uniref:hypothetical protein n=1 Tax=Bradyrhizobium sp. SRL28 TaxID=2836178 RepID=UPI00201B99A3|nr:hypothetical protein [Bradyrhizobium sp. SRL28]
MSKLENKGDMCISIIPFAKDVNLGTSYKDESWIDWDLWSDQNDTWGTCSNTSKKNKSDCLSNASRVWTPDKTKWTDYVTDRTKDFDTTNTLTMVVAGVRVAVDARRPRARGIAGRPQAWSWGCERLIRARRAAQFAYGKSVWFWHPWLVSSWRRLIESNRVRWAVNPAATEARGIRLREERAISRQTIAQGRPDALHWTCMLVCALLVPIAHETAGAARTRPSLRPHDGEGQEITQNSGASRREIEEPCALLFQRWRRSDRRCKYRKKKPGRNGRAFLLSKYQIAEVSDRERISARPG